MGTTSGALPYPEATDPVAGGAAAIKALALAVTDRIAMGQAAGYYLIQNITANAIKSVTVTFPAGRFVQPPNVQVSLAISAPHNRAISIGTPTATSVILYCENLTASTSSGPMRWFAHESPGMQSQLLAATPQDEGGTFGRVACPTAECGNHGVSLEVQTGYVDEAGQAHAVDEVACGVCGTPLDVTENEAGTGAGREAPQ